MKDSLILKLLICMSLAGTIASLSACGGKEYEVVEKTTYIYLGVPKNLTTEIKPDSTPDKVAFIQASYEDRVQMCMDWGGKVLKTTKDLNNRMTNIRTWDAQNKSMIDQRNKDEEARVTKIVGDITKAVKASK